jgi:hypothetical protein
VYVVQGLVEMPHGAIPKSSIPAFVLRLSDVFTRPIYQLFGMMQATGTIIFGASDFCVGRLKKSRDSVKILRYAG